MGPGEQAALARDAYSYLHYPLIAGIVLLALGLKEHSSRPARSSKPCRRSPSAAGLRSTSSGRPPSGSGCWGRSAPIAALATVVLLALIPLALGADALGALAAVAAVLAVLIAYEAVLFRQARAQVRANPSASLAEMRG
jgi:uncharacterized membrane protein